MKKHHMKKEHHMKMMHGHWEAVEPMEERKERKKRIEKRDVKRDDKREKKHKWIQEAIKHLGALRKELHVKPGHNIPAKKLKMAAKKKGKEGFRARLAETFKKMRNKKD